MSIFPRQYSSMMRTLPYVEDGKLFRPGHRGDQIMIGTSTWFDWLEQHAAFTFVEAAGTFTAYKRPPFAADSPWDASHKRDGRPERLLLGPSCALTPERLRDAARTLAAGRVQAHATVTSAVTCRPSQRAVMVRVENFARRPGDEVQIATGVQALSAAAAARDGHTAVHAHQLVELALATAGQLGQPEEDLHLLRLGAILHDIGKIGIPDAILYKPGPLTEEEWLIMRRHPDIGEHILQQTGGVFEQLAAVVVTHHERWDGKGYPRQLAGRAIPLHARILAVVDAYDAMTSPRVYRKPMTTGQARAELLRCSGTQFDPQVVEAFLRALKELGALPQDAMQMVPV